MIGIYCIENNINHKKYIGQSKNIHKRVLQHINDAKNNINKNYEFYHDIIEYGIDSFSFYVLEECSLQSLEEKEMYYIEKYDTVKNGYNNTYGGSGSKKLSSNDLNRIEELLLNNVSQQDIADEINVSRELIQGINTGRYYFREDKKYPIKDYNDNNNNNGNKKNSKNINNGHNNKIKRLTVCPLCGNEMWESSDMCLECYLKDKAKNIPQRDVLLDLILNNSFSAIGKMYNVSDNAVRNWCKKYNLPYKRKDVILFKSSKKE